MKSSFLAHTKVAFAIGYLKTAAVMARKGRKAEMAYVTKWPSFFSHDSEGINNYIWLYYYVKLEFI